MGIDPCEHALALAREQVAAADAGGQIQLRQASVEDLKDAEQFDLAWMPTFFISGAVLEQAIPRVHTALRPRGWATFGLYARPGVPFIDAPAELRTVRQGGALRTPDEVAASLTSAGFADVAIHSSADWRPPMVVVAGRK